MGGQLLTSANYLPIEKTSARRQLVERTPAEIDAGYAYINAHAPTGFQRNQHLTWIEKELRSVESPIYEWDRALVKEAVRNKQTARGLADEIQSYP
eukprot:467096-Amphidinium_carterae.1